MDNVFSTQLAKGQLKFQLGAEAQGNKTNEIDYSSRPRCYVFSFIS